MLKKFIVTIIVFSILAIAVNESQLAFAGACLPGSLDSDGDGICDNDDPFDFDPCLPNPNSQACIDSHVIGGKIIPIEITSLLLAGAQSTTWMIPVVLSGIGIGLFVVSRKSENS